MRDSKWLKVSALLFALIAIASCVSAGLQTVRVDPDGSTATSGEEKPEGFIEDAATMGEFSLFSGQVNDKISQAMKEKDPKIAFRAAQAVICDGKKPRYSPSYNVHLIIPKPPKGTAVDVAGQKREEFLKLVRLKLKEHFFEGAAGDNNRHVTRERDGKYNHDFAGYLESKKEGIEEYKRHWFPLPIPVVFSRDSKSIESHYADMRLLPKLHNPSLSLIWEDLYGVVIPKDRTVILVPRVFTFVTVQEKSEPQISIGSPRLNVYIPNGGGNLNFLSLDRRPFFIVSDYGWKIDGLKKWGEHEGLYTDKPLYPLRVASMSDLTFLKEYYTFMLPQESICRIMHPSQEDGSEAVDCTNYKGADRNWGYDDSGKFSPKKAINWKDEMWDRILKSQTSTKEAAEPDGIRFEVGLDLSLYCEYGTPISDLISQ